MHTTRYWNNLHQVRSKSNKRNGQQMGQSRMDNQKNQMIRKANNCRNSFGICNLLSDKFSFEFYSFRTKIRFTAWGLNNIGIFLFKPLDLPAPKDCCIIMFPRQLNVSDDGYFRNTKLYFYIVITQLIVLKYLVNILIPAFLFSLSSI